jgi:hypothetical protein
LLKLIKLHGKDWKKISKHILERDNFSCVNCNNTQKEKRKRKLMNCLEQINQKVQKVRKAA